RNLRRDFALGNQRGPIGHDLFDLGPPAAEACYHGWAVQSQRCDFLGEALHWCSVCRTYTDAKPDFGDIRRWLTGERAMTSIHAYKLAPNSIELQAQPIEALAQDAIRRLGLGISIGPGIRQHADRFESRRVTDGNLVEI